MEDDRANPPPTAPLARIKVVGVGGGGSSAVERMISSGLHGVDFVTINTDARALRRSSAPSKLHLGASLTKGLGAGGHPDIGRAAALEDLAAIERAVAGADMVFVAAGLGGGTGTGAAPVVAAAARASGALTVGVVTRPFAFEGRRRQRQAEQGAASLLDSVDALITIPNERLVALAGEHAPLLETFQRADEVLLQAVRAIADIITVNSYINVDLADVRAILSSSGVAVMGTGTASGERRALSAARQALENPLVEATGFAGAMGVVINLTGGPGLTMREVGEACARIQETAHPDANIIFGSTVDPALGERVSVTVIATGFRKPEAHGVVHERALPSPPGSNSADDGRLAVPTFLRTRR